MKTNEINLEVYDASASFSGYGHYLITVELKHFDNYKKFKCTTSNMPALDEAKELRENDSIQEYYEALYSIIEEKISDEVRDWINSL